jgi:hypothetical protein
MNRDTNPDQWAELYRQIFEVDKRGAAILEHMVVLFSKPASTTGGIDAVLKTYLHMGENNVVQHILSQLNRANQVPDTQENQE